MSRKPKTPKVRHTWAINPKTRIAPNKKADRLVCAICGGTGISFVACSAEGSYEDCMGCGGNGYAD